MFVENSIKTVGADRGGPKEYAKGKMRKREKTEEPGRKKVAR